MVQIFQLLLSLVVLQAALAVQPAVAAPSAEQQTRAAQPAARSVVEEIVTEPVFQGHAYVREAGRGNPYTVVLVHGLGGTASRDWDHVIPALARRYHVVTFDLPGFGRSEKRNALYSPAAYAEFVKWIVDERVDGPFTLVGHSMGAVVSLRYASIYHRNLQHLVMVDAPGILYRSVAFQGAGRLVAGPKLDALLPNAVDSIWGRFLAGMEGRFFTPDADVILASRNLREQVLKGEPEPIAALALAQEDFSPRLRFVTEPVTLIWGTKDLVAPIRTARALMAQLPNVRLIPLDGVGHSPMTEAPDRFDFALLQNIAAPTTVPPRGPAAAVGATQLARFTGERGRSISGAYKRLEIEDCDDFTLNNVTAESIQIKNSTVRVENGRFVGGAQALTAYDSTVTMTGGVLAGDVAILADRSEFDLAGVTIEARKAVVQTQDWTKITFSISTAALGTRTWYLQGIEQITPDLLPWPKPPAK